jgi:hypothetical protein
LNCQVGNRKLNLEGRKYRQREGADNYIPTIDREPMFVHMNIGGITAGV